MPRACGGCQGYLIGRGTGGCNGATPGGQAPEGALPGVKMFPLKRGLREPMVLSQVVSVGGGLYSWHEDYKGGSECW